MDKILILDFGSQSTQLIGRRVRQLGVYSEIVPGDIPFDSADLEGARGIILSGSPASVYEPDAPTVDSRFYGLGLPLLGICYGLHRMATDHGGRVAPLGHKEYGRARVEVLADDPLFARVPGRSFVSWMSHGDTVAAAPPGFGLVARSEGGLPAAFADASRKMWGVQFHPEASHCEHGMEVLEAFVVDIAGSRREWSMEEFLRRERDGLAKRLAGRTVVLLISGGVDSSVVAALLLASLDHDAVHLLYVNTGLMREGESGEVMAGLKELGARHLHAVDASERFYAGLAGVEDPEQKRKIIGDLFITVQQRGDRAARARRLLARPGHPLHGPRRKREGGRLEGDGHQDPSQRPFPARRGAARPRTRSWNRSPCCTRTRSGPSGSPSV